jgi:hypothetical protein
LQTAAQNPIFNGGNSIGNQGIKTDYRFDEALRAHGIPARGKGLQAPHLPEE